MYCDYESLKSLFYDIADIIVVFKSILYIFEQNQFLCMQTITS